MDDSLIGAIAVWVLPVLVAITFHEAAHGWAAWYFGDPTAKQQGRLTFNPVVHLDPVGTILIPGLLLLTNAGFLFGWAKPVPVNPRYMKSPRRDMMFVAAAGPATNIVLAFGSALLMHTVPFMSGDVAMWTALTLRNSILLNLVLAVLNMLPIPPLDGGKVAMGLLPRRYAIKLEALEGGGGLFLVLGVLFLLPFLAGKAGFHIPIVEWLILFPVSILAKLLYLVTGF